VPVVEGTVERIVFRNVENGYTVARIKIDDATRLFRDDLVTVVGTLPNVNPGEIVECTGEWELSAEHGRQLRVAQFVPHTPVSAKGLARYLGSGIIKGIGPKTAERIVAAFGDQTLAIIELEPERLIEIKGISASKRDAIIQGWDAQREVRKIMLFLQEHHISPSLAQKIYSAYGQAAISTIQQNPYQLEQDIYGVGFKTADAIARELGLPPESLPRLATGIKHTLNEMASEGHCFALREDLLAQAAAILGVLPELLPPALDDLVQRKEAFVEEERVFLAPFFYSEMGSARRIRLLQKTPSPLPPLTPQRWDALLAEAQAEFGTQLATQQRYALHMAYENKVSILTGGPGTGKTTTIRTLVHVLERYNVPFVMAAPTGRAARRMTEATGHAARTLHRLLEFIPNTNQFARNEERPLDAQFVIVDEVSMIDLILMYNLLKALDTRTHLLLVGDADQLPSVGAGNVLHDLLTSEVIPATHLTELFRQAAASRIIVTAHGVRDGRMPDLRPDPQADFFFMPAATPEAAARLVQDLVIRRLPQRYGYEPVRDIQALAPMYKGACGVTALNDVLQSQINHGGGEAVTAGARTLRMGDKVMQLKNDYDKNVFNGDVGFVTVIDPHDGLVVVQFGDAPVSYAFHELDALALAYAVSIHRAQGSEYPVVVLPLVMQHALLLQRNLLYTAITRAKRLCVVVGEERALRYAIQNDEVAARNTALAERLHGPQLRGAQTLVSGEQ
jgi:exodeoxyribonuclease V alpha subunit